MGDDRTPREECTARLTAAQAGRAEASAALTAEGCIGRAFAERLLAEYDERMEMLRAEGPRQAYTIERARAAAGQRRAALHAERTELLRLRQEHAINDETLLRIQFDLDAEEARIPAE